MLINVDIPETVNSRKRISVSVDLETYNFLKDKKRVFGTVSNYLRNLIIQERDKLLIPQQTTVLRQIQLTEIQTTTNMLGPPKAADQKGIQLLGYGDHHLELMNELKAKVKRID